MAINFKDAYSQYSGKTSATASVVFKDEEEEEEERTPIYQQTVTQEPTQTKSTSGGIDFTSAYSQYASRQSTTESEGTPIYPTSSATDSIRQFREVNEIQSELGEVGDWMSTFDSPEDRDYTTEEIAERETQYDTFYDSYAAKKSELTSELQSLNQEISDTQSDLQGEKYSGLTGAEDFASLSASKVGDTSGTIKDAMAGVIETVPTNDELLRVYKNLSDDELAIYNYVLEKNGTESAEEYLDYVQSSVDERIGTNQAETIQSLPAALEVPATVGYGVYAGLDQFSTGLEQWATNEQLPTTSAQYGSSLIREGLEETGPSVLGNSLGQIGYDAVTNAANMAPSILLSALTGGTAGMVLGTGSMGASAAGNAYSEAIGKGLTQEEAGNYGLIVGASEAVLQSVLGGVASLGGVSGAMASKISSIDNALLRVAAEVGVDMLGEATDEGLQTVLEPVFESLITGTEYEAATFEDVAYSALLGAIIGAPSGVVTGVGDAQARASATETTQTQSETTAPTTATPSAPVVEQRETQAVTATTPLSTASQQAMDGGTVTNSMAEAILADSASMAELQSAVGTINTAQMTKSQQRAAVKSAVATYASQQGTTSATETVGETIPTSTAPTTTTPSVAPTRVTPTTPTTQTETTTQSVERQQLAKVAETLGEEGAKRIQSLYNDDTSATDYYAGFVSYYDAGVSSLGIDSVVSKYSSALNEAQQNAAYLAGQQDAATSLAKEIGDVASATVQGDGAGLVQNQYVTTIPRQEAKLYNALATSLGVKIELVNSVKDGAGNGSYNPTTGVIQLSTSASNPLAQVAAHEITHRLQELAPAEYRAYRDVAINYIAKEAGQTVGTANPVREKINHYAQNGVTLTAEQAMDEVAADFTSLMIEDGTLFESLAKENRTVAQKVVDVLSEFIQKVKAIFTSKSAQDSAAMAEYGVDMDTLVEAERLWMEALTAAETEVASVSEQALELSDRDVKYSLREKAPPKKTGVAYKVFYAKDGQLYPPMVANPGGVGTPVGVWLDADVGTQGAPSKTGRPQVQAGGKGTNAGKSSLAFRPGWHLGDVPQATQFARKNAETGVKDLFPSDFVWAECEYDMDRDYQEEAMSYGYTEKGAFRHSYAGLPRLPEDGYYRYRTNPNPDTVAWVITGAMKVNRILTDAETDAIVRDAGMEPMARQGGPIDLAALGITETDFTQEQESTTDGDSKTKFSLKDSSGNTEEVAESGRTNSQQFKRWFGDSAVVDDAGAPMVVYHGTGTTIEEFNPDLTGKGNDQYGSGFYFTTSNDTAEGYTQRTLAGQEKLGGTDNPNVIPVYLSIQNPIVVDSATTPNLYEMDVSARDAEKIIAKLPDIMDGEESILGDFVERYWETGPDEDMITELANMYPWTIGTLETDIFKSNPSAFRAAVTEVLGYDGVQVNFPSGETHYVAWQPNQIKHATENSGAYSTGDNRIKYSLKEDSEGKTLTDGQISFFSNSKVVDDQGNLMVMYHGTTTYGEITKFKKGSKGWLGAGIYLTNRKSDAQRYADNMGEGNGTMYELYANITNPLTVTSGNPVPEILRAAYGRDSIYTNRQQKQSNDSMMITSADIKKLKNNGYDGIMWVFGGSVEISAFSPEQVKRTTNTEPTSSADIRYSLKEEPGTKRTYAALARENEALREKVEYYRGQTQRSKSATTDKKAVTKAANALIKSYGAELDSKEVFSDLQTLYDGIASGEMGFTEAKARADAIAQQLVDSASAVDDEMYNQYSDLRAYARTAKLTISGTDAQNIADFGDFQKRNFGRINISSGETNIDRYYMEMVERWPMFFDEQVESHPADQLVRISEVLADIYNVTEYNPFSQYSAQATADASNEIMETFFDLPQTKATFADKAAQKLDVTKAAGRRATIAAQEKASAKLAELRTQNRQKAQELVAKERTARSEAIATLTAERKTAVENAVLAGMMSQGRTDAKAATATQARNDKALERANQRTERATEKGQAAVAREKARTATARAKTAEAKAEGQARLTEHRQRQSAREMRAKILRHTSDLSQKLLRPSDKNHIPQELQAPVAQMLEAINNEGVYSIDPETGKRKKNADGDPTKRTEAFRALRDAYSQIAKNGTDTSLVLDPDLADNLEAVAQMRDTKLQNMSAAQLETVWQAVKGVEASVRTANQMLGTSRFETVSEVANGIQADNEGRKDRGDYKGVVGKVDKLVNLDMLTPEAYFHRLGDTADGVFKMLRSAQDAQISLMEEAQKATTKIVEGANVRAMERELHHFVVDGEPLTMSTAQIMSLYELMKRPQALEHIMVGGIRPNALTASGSARESRPANPARVTLEDLSTITDTLTAEQKKMADGLQNYMGDVLSSVGNQASMEVYGYEKFNEDHYFPIKVDSNQTKKDVAKDATAQTIAGTGFTKQTTPKANNAVMVDGIFDVYAEHVSGMTTYGAWLSPMENLRRIRDFAFWEVNEEGKNARVGSVKATIETALGKSGNSYLNTLMDDLNQGIKASGTGNLTDGIIGNYKAAAVAGNLRVILQQPTAILRAMDSLDPKYLAQGVVKAGDWEKVKKYAPIAQWKDWGYFDINTGRQMKDVLLSSDSMMEKVKQASMAGAGKADSFAWARLWNGVEAETKDKRPGLTVGSEAYYQVVAERFNEIIDHTQVVDGILQRSQIMRSPDALTKMSTSFMAEPTKTYNMFTNAVYDVRHSSGAQRTEAKRQLARTTGALAVSFAVNALMQSLVDGLRDDDKELDYWTKVLQAYGGFSGDETTATDYWNSFWNGNLQANLNPLAYLPYFKDILSIVEGYDVTRMDMEAIEGVITAATNLNKAISGEGAYTLAEASAEFVAEASRLVGIPVANLKREILAVVTTAAIETDNYLLQYKIDRAALNMNYSSNTSGFMDILYNAMENDAEAYEFILEDMMANGITEEKIQTAMETRMKRDQGVESVSDLVQRYLTPAKEAVYNSTVEKVSTSSIWSKATADQREAVEDDIYNLVTGTSSGVAMQEKMDSAALYGISEEEYILFELAKDVVGDGNSSTSQSEAEAAIAMLTGLSANEKSYLWSSINSGWSEDNNPYK